jgi:hypothetical protein
MSATAQTLTGWSNGEPSSLVRRVRALSVRRAVACLACAIACGGVAWNWATLLAGALHMGWVGPAAGLVAGLWIAGLIAGIDADEQRR